jgi:hypothetical protein
MNGGLYENTKVAAYFLWEQTQCESALDLWYCAEDIACYFDRKGIFTVSQVDDIKRLGVYNMDYVSFVRHLAFRIYIYTNRIDSETNWYAAERLLAVNEWIHALVCMAKMYHDDMTDDVRSENIKAYYDEQTSQSSN